MKESQYQFRILLQSVGWVNSVANDVTDTTTLRSHLASATEYLARLQQNSALFHKCKTTRIFCHGPTVALILTFEMLGKFLVTAYTEMQRESIGVPRAPSLVKWGWNNTSQRVIQTRLQHVQKLCRGVEPQ